MRQKMTSKEYLHMVWMTPIRIRELECEEKAIKEDIQHLSATDYSTPRVSGGGCGRDMTDDIAKHMEAMDNVRNEWKRWIKLRIECRDIIMMITSGKNTEIFQTVLKYRYLEHLKWEEIAVRMGYSYRGVTKIHGKALLAFGKVFKSVHISSYR